MLQPTAHAVEPQPRTFTREEAQALLPEVDRVLGEAQALAEKLEAAEQEAQSAQKKSRSNGAVHAGARGEPPESTRQAIAQELGRLLERLHDMGIVVRDVRSGLIDFPSLRDGRVIHLCWRRGESLEIRWWHEVAAGFAGRQRLEP